MPDTEATKNFESASETADTVLKYAFWATLTLNVVMSGSESMDYFLVMLNSLQLIIHLPMLWVIMPGNVTMFFRLILPIVMFDVLNGLDDTPYDPNNFIEYDEEQNELDKNKFISQMKDLGYNTHNAILNLGSLFILLLVYFLRMIFLIFLFLIKILTGKCKETFQNQKRKVFFNDLLLLLVEGYMEFFISGYLNFQKPLFESGYLGERISIVTNWFSMFGTLLIAPVALCYMIDQDQVTLETHEFEQSFGSLYEGIKTDTRATRSYFFFFVLRRLIFSCVSFFLTWSSAIQLQCVLSLNILMGIYNCYFRSKKLRIFNRIEVASEFLIQLATVHLMIFTDYLPDPDIQYKAGFSMIGAIVILMMGHMAFVIYYGTKTLMLVVQKYYRLAKFKIFGPQKIEVEEPQLLIQPTMIIEKNRTNILDKYIYIQNQQKLSKISEELNSVFETPQETPRQVPQIEVSKIYLETPREEPQVELPETPREVPQVEKPQIKPVTQQLKKASIDIKEGLAPIIEESTLINVKLKKMAKFNLPTLRPFETFQKSNTLSKKKKKPKKQKPDLETELETELKKIVQQQMLEFEIQQLIGNLEEDQIQKKAQQVIDAELEKDILDCLQSDHTEH